MRPHCRRCPPVASGPILEISTAFAVVSNALRAFTLCNFDGSRLSFVDPALSDSYTHTKGRLGRSISYPGGCAVYNQSNVMAMVDVVLPVEEFWGRVARDALLVVGFTLFMVLFARFSIHLPFTPVPVTGQTFAMLTTGAALGSWRGSSSMGLYLVVGMFLPVYAGSADGYLWQAGVGDYVFGFSGGSSGFFWQLTSGGYIIGFVAAAWLVGFMCERGIGSSVWVLPALLAGNALVYVPGLIQLSLFAPEGKTLEWGLYPFIAGDLVKLFLAAMLIPGAWGLITWLRGDDYERDHGHRNSNRDRWL